MTALPDLPVMPADAAPVIVPGLLTGLGVVPRHPVPAWITDPTLIESIALGFMEVPDDLVVGEHEKTKPELPKRPRGPHPYRMSVEEVAK